jgi:hypothetical protein
MTELTAVTFRGEIRQVKIKELNWMSHSKNIPIQLWNFLPNDSYIICPRNSKPPYEVQVGITGTAWKGEAHKKAISREIQEECGLVMTRNPRQILELEHRLTKNRAGSNYTYIKNWLWCVVGTRFCRPAKGIASKKKGTDNKNCKIGALLYETNPVALVKKLVASSKNGGFTQLVDDNLFEILLVPSHLAYKMAYTPPINKNIVSKETLEIIARGPLNNTELVDNKRWPTYSKSKKKKY